MTGWRSQSGVFAKQQRITEEESRIGCLVSCCCVINTVKNTYFLVQHCYVYHVLNLVFLTSVILPVYVLQYNLELFHNCFITSDLNYCKSLQNVDESI